MTTPGFLPETTEKGFPSPYPQVGTMIFPTNWDMKKYEKNLTNSGQLIIIVTVRVIHKPHYTIHNTQCERQGGNMESMTVISNTTIVKQPSIGAELFSRQCH